MAWRFLVHVLFAMVGICFVMRMPVITGAVTIVALASLVAEQMIRGVWLSRCVCGTASYNVVGRVPARRGAGRRLVLCAHYDTQPIGLIWAIARRCGRIWAHCPLLLKPPMLVLGLLMGAQILLAAGSHVIPDSRGVWWLATLLLGAYLAFAIIFVQWALSRFNPGAADNASGVAAVLEMAEAWQSGRPADDVELIVLLTGCEESGLMGAAAFADRHRDELAGLPTTILNIDGIAFGPPRFLGAEVPAIGIPLRAPVDLIGACAQTAAELGLSEAGPHALPGPTDALAFLARRIPAISIVGFAEGERLPHYHTMADTVQNMNFAAAGAGTAFAKAVARKLASKGSSPHSMDE
jgi:hypothetical protein